MSTIAEIKNNESQNGIEIYFKVYPLTGTKETMKKNGFRWNRKKGCWYAKKSLDTENIAGIMADTTLTEYEDIAKKTGEEVKAITVNKTRSTLTKPKTEIINLDNLGENTPLLYGAELSKAIRDDLKKRGVAGVSVRAKGDSITVTVKATAADFVSIEEAKERYTFSHFSCDADRGFYDGEKWVHNFHELSEEEKTRGYEKYLAYSIKKIDSVNQYRLNKRDNFWELKTDFYNKLCAIYKIANQWNYDNSDLMTDYHDVGYYLDIDIKKPDDFEPVESMTEEEREALAEERRIEEEKEKAEIERLEAERKQREAEHQAYEAQRKIDRDAIKNDIEIVDLAEEDYIYITDLIGGIGKECTLDELYEELNTDHKNDAIITRKVIFHSKETFEIFGKYLIDSFDFLNGKGGTGSEDIRLDEVENVYNLNKVQRESVKWYMCDCVAIYVNNDLKIVSNPEGYSYSRYTYILSETSEIKTAQAECERQRADSKKKEPFYFPAKVEEQATNIHVGQEITVYQCDGWILNSIYGGFGTVEKVYPGDYAQYTGVYIDLTQGKKKKTVFIRDNKKILIYEGIMPPLPESVTEEKISDNMSLLHNEDVLFKKAYRYYKDKGILPIVDTWQR